jgi:hypothetical protein
VYFGELLPYFIRLIFASTTRSLSHKPFNAPPSPTNSVVPIWRPSRQSFPYRYSPVFRVFQHRFASRFHTRNQPAEPKNPQFSTPVFLISSDRVCACNRHHLTSTHGISSSPRLTPLRRHRPRPPQVCRRPRQYRPPVDLVYRFRPSLNRQARRSGRSPPRALRSLPPGCRSPIRQIACPSCA